MRVLWYPDGAEVGESSPVWNTLKRDLKKRQDLMLKVETFLRRVRGLTDLEPLLKSEEIWALGDGLWEMRIPKTASGGVVRIYFCKDQAKPANLILLDAELKHKKAPARRDTAHKRMNEYRQWNRG